MSKFLVDLWLDGSEKETSEACKTFINDQLDFSASDVKITDFEKELNNFLNWYLNEPCKPGTVVNVQEVCKKYLEKIS